MARMRGATRGSRRPPVSSAYGAGVLVRLVVAWHVARMRTAIAMLAVLACPAVGAAHVAVLPDASAAGGWQRYSILVPTEKASPTVRVSVKLPTGMEVIAVESKPGWQGTHNPLPIGAATVEWKGGRIPENEFVSFEFLAWNPPAARVIQWEATQWYEDGTSDRWGGAGDAEHASKTTLAPAAGGAKGMHRHGAPAGGGKQP
jgi:uncharacterized protein YcnI